MKLITAILITLIGGGILFVISSVFAWASISRMIFIKKVLKILHQLPDNAKLICEGERVSAIGYDSKTREQKNVYLYSGLITWKDKQHEATQVRKFAQRQFNLRLAVTICLVLPLFVLTIYGGIVYNYKIFAASALLIAEQVYPFYIGPNIMGSIQEGL